MKKGFTLVELLVTLAILGMMMATVVTVYMTGNTIGTTGENKAEAQQGARAAMLVEEELRLVGYGVPSSQGKFPAASPAAVTFWADVLNVSTTLSGDVASGNTTLNVLSAAGIVGGDTVYLINGDCSAAVSVKAVDVPAKTITVNAWNVPSATCLTPPVPAFPRGSQVGRPRQVTYSWNAGTTTLSKDAGDGTGLLPLATGIQNLQFRYFDTGDVEILPANLNANLANIRRIQIQVTAQSAAAEHRGTFTMTSSVRPRNL